MPKKATYKSKGGDKDAATKNTFNPPATQQSGPPGDTDEPFHQDPKRRIGQFGGAGEPPLIKK
jgi:hypothetical protein